MSLRAFRDYCLAMSEDTDDQKDRDLWRQLAYEVDLYLDGRRGNPPAEVAADDDDLLVALEELVAQKRETTPDP